MHGPRRQVRDVCLIDFDLAAANLCEDVVVVIQDTDPSAMPENVGSWLELCSLSATIVPVAANNLTLQKRKKPRNEFAAQPSLVQEIANLGVAVSSLDARAEPGYESCAEESIDADSQWCCSTGRGPYHAVTRFPDDPMDLNACGSVGIGNVHG